MSLPCAEPLFFGSRTRPLSGWLHRTASLEPAPVGVVLCNPFGYEAISAHRTLKHLAQELAAAGIPALRFDYDGTGDSAGTDFDPDRHTAWVSSVHQAAETLRGETGCGRLVLFGIRLGATLAALAAQERTDVVGWIGLAPVINAKAYIRELRALQMAGRAAEGGTPNADDVTEVTGFVLTPQTRGAISGVDLAKLERAPAAQILILDRNDLPGNERWATQLQSLGATVTRQALPGYTEMMLSPHSAIVPADMLHAAVAWVKGLPAAAPAPLRGDPRAVFGRSVAMTVPHEAGSAAIVETALSLPTDHPLFGILTLPRDLPKSGCGVVLLNAGGTHHIGPNRMYVMFARTWATRGHAVLRLDISGIGDSSPRPGESENAIYTTRAADDVAQAIRYLREHAGVAQCHVIGLCSGAYHALKAAVGGVPADSIVMINPLTFFWKDGMSLEAMPEPRVIWEAQRYQKSAFKLGAWLKLIRGQVDISRILHIIVRRVSSVTAHFCRDIARRFGVPLRDDLGRELQKVGRSRIRMLFLFANGDPGIELLRAQGGSVLKRLQQRGQLEVEIIGGADHTFTARQPRALLASTLEKILAAPRPYG